MAHQRWLASRKFEHAAQQIVFQEAIDAIEDALQRLHRLEKQLALIVPEWSMLPVVEAYRRCDPTEGPHIKWAPAVAANSSRRPGHTAIPRRVSETLRARLEGLPKPMRDIAWKKGAETRFRHPRIPTNTILAFSVC